MDTSAKSRVTQHPAFWIVVAALVLRLWNIHWGLPEVYEEAYPFSVAWKFWTWGTPGLDFNPHFFNYPALSFYLNFLVQAIHYLFGSLAGLYPTPMSFSQAFTTDPSMFIVTGRLVSVAFDLGTVYVAYRLGDAVGGRRTAVVAGLLVAINPLHLRQAHLINVDTPLAFFTLLTIYFVYRLVLSPKPKRYIHIGIVAGLAVASKYTGAVVLLGFAILVVALWLRKGKVRPTLREVITTFLWAGVAFHAVNPFSVLELNEFITDVGFERFHAGYGHLGLDPSQSTIGYYLLTALPENLGLPLMIVLAATAVYVVVRRRRRKYILLAFAALYLTGIGLWEMRAERYLLPVMPVLLVLCAWGLFAFGELIRGKFARGVRCDFVLGALTLVAAIVPAAKVLTYQHTHEKPDTRTVAKQLIRKNLPGGSAIVVAPMGINLDARYLVLQLPFNPVETERLTPFYDARWYAGFDLAVVSDYDEARYLLEPERFGEILGFYRELKERRPLVAEVVPEEHQNGPTIRMVALRGQAEAQTYPPDLFANLARVGHDETVLDFLYNLSEVLYAKDYLQKGRQALRAGLALAPGDARFLRNMAWTCFRMGDHPAALDAVEDALKAEPNRPEMVSLKGSVLLKLGRYDEAERHLLTALSLNDRLLSAYVDLSEVYERQGKPDLAVGTLERLRSLVAPGSPEARFVEERMSALRGMGKK